jgi:uncharacterized protein YecE (DUF72 family)
MAAAASYIGCAGWSLPLSVQSQFAGQGTHLQRYATRFNAAEINSSFHRPHSAATYRRWAESVPDGFLFSVKLPRTITHKGKLIGGEALLDEFMAQASGLGPRLGCLLVQLPPSLAFEAAVAATFFEALRQRWQGAVSAEPRHASWLGPEADALLSAHRVARVLADPVRHPDAASPGGWRGFAYLRLHGSPRMYYSAYEPQLIDALAARMALALRDRCPVWCIFDNTAGGAAADNALRLQLALEKERA